MSGGGHLVHISAISLSGTEWMPAGKEESEYGTNESALPPELEGFSTALAHKDNYKYLGPREGSAQMLQQHIADNGDWEGSDTVKFEKERDFTVTVGSRLLLRGGRH